MGRLGGDEFAAFLCGRVTDEMVRQRAADICAQLHIVLGDREIIHLTASVGVYLAGRGQEFEGLYQTADLALYKAKKAGIEQKENNIVLEDGLECILSAARSRKG